MKVYGHNIIKIRYFLRDGHYQTESFTNTLSFNFKKKVKI